MVPTKNHNIGFNKIVDMANTSLFSYENEVGVDVKNGFCIGTENVRYCYKTIDGGYYPITQSVVGDLISSIKVLSEKNKELEKSNREMKKRLEAFEDNLRVLRNKVVG